MTGRELRKIRKGLGWSQSRLAGAVGISSNGLAMQERGEIGISEPVGRLVRLVAAGVNVDAIVNAPRSGRASAHKPPKPARARHPSRQGRKGKG